MREAWTFITIDASGDPLVEVRQCLVRSTNPTTDRATADIEGLAAWATWPLSRIYDTHDQAKDAARLYCDRLAEKCRQWTEKMSR